MDNISTNLVPVKLKKEKNQWSNQLYCYFIESIATTDALFSGLAEIL